MAKLSLRIAIILSRISRSRWKQHLGSRAAKFFQQRQAQRTLQQQLWRELASSPSIRFRRLEPRRVLNASFALAGGQLDLTALASTDLTINYDGLNTYDITLSSGTWFDGATDTLSASLLIDSGDLTGLLNMVSGFDTDVIFAGTLNPFHSVSLETAGEVRGPFQHKIRHSGTA